mmetsp:Transcript_57068/g.100193  ORF Transcript_57068/g.100193 Transcript_57068/m.100193 type:complete len:463 (-) Transcript_57068:126-1514(-)|eukprot:CAMPEP_0185004054 /NCGR_PEP_ID=MMETSP1098-20130426/78216_1 /TAXON_ID=89044 /ORGANISM="Spumella elongata, Strain CCAP 955/1" /LENGTH=462 /DNA_ID=CAMNT_0027531815 /DNA_START=39 /DNA_END=1427 /DNA_ORIENTATION=-
MSESRVIEIFEVQSYSRSAKWQPHSDVPWATKEPPEPCLPLLEITLPNNEWSWASEWVIDKKPGATDEDGWEYASRLTRFLAKDRIPKAEAHRGSTVRRRLWTRIMRREIGIRTADIPKALQKIQIGLGSIHSARVRIEDIMKQAPSAGESEQMVSLVRSVKKNINDVVSSLDQISAHQHKNGSPNTTANAAVKKLRNDVMKEDAAIDKAVNPGKTSPVLNSHNRDFLKLQKAQSNSFVDSRGTPTGGGSFIGSRSRGNTSPPRTAPNLRRVGSFVTGGSGSNGVAPPSPGNNSNPFLSSTAMPSLNELDGENRDRPPSLRMPVTGGSSSGAGGVKSGRADTFNPSVFQSANHIAGVDSDQGLFVDRNKRDLQIMEKFVAIDEATVMQEIIDERDVEIKKVHTGLVQVNEMFTDLARLVKEQEVEIEHIFDNADESREKTKAALDHIVEADRLQKNGNCTIS